MRWQWNSKVIFLAKFEPNWTIGSKVMAIFASPFQHFDAGQSRVRKSSNIRRTLSLWVRSSANPRSRTNEDPYDQVIKFVKLPILLYSSKIWGCILFSTFNNDPQNESWHFLKIFMKNLEKLWKKYYFMKILELSWNKYKISKIFRKIMKLYSITKFV